MAEADDGRSTTMVSRREGSNVISYADEDPLMRKMFNEALERNGVAPRVRQ